MYFINAIGDNNPLIRIMTISKRMELERHILVELALMGEIICSYPEELNEGNISQVS
jgi:hypothetical protein